MLPCVRSIGAVWKPAGMEAKGGRRKSILFGEELEERTSVRVG